MNSVILAGMGLKNSTDRTDALWMARLERVRELSQPTLSSAAILQFYIAVLELQYRISRHAIQALRPAPIRQQIDLSHATSAFEDVLNLAVSSGPAPLAGYAKLLQQMDTDKTEEMFQSFIASPAIPPDDPNDFFMRACLQPIAESLQLQISADAAKAESTCPACGGFPQLFILRPEGEGASRWLQCSFCLLEWRYRRIVCPWCGEQDKEKLPRFSSHDLCTHVHVYACDTCKKYLKTVDMTLEGHAVPLVDEVAFAVLDIWASERGYRKITPNLMGF